jgi:hypothetical protein
VVEQGGQTTRISLLCGKTQGENRILEQNLSVYQLLAIISDAALTPWQGGFDVVRGARSEAGPIALAVPPSVVTPAMHDAHIHIGNI